MREPTGVTTAQMSRDAWALSLIEQHLWAEHAKAPRQAVLSRVWLDDCFCAALLCRMLASASNSANRSRTCPSMSDSILIVPQLAHVPKVVEKTGYSVRRNGQLAAFEVGGRWAFKGAGLDQWTHDPKANARDDQSRREM